MQFKDMAYSYGWTATNIHFCDLPRRVVDDFELKLLQLHVIPYVSPGVSYSAYIGARGGCPR